MRPLPDHLQPIYDRLQTDYSDCLIVFRDTPNNQVWAKGRNDWRIFSAERLRCPFSCDQFDRLVDRAERMGVRVVLLEPTAA